MGEARFRDGELEEYAGTQDEVFEKLRSAMDRGAEEGRIWPLDEMGLAARQLVVAIGRNMSIDAIQKSQWAKEYWALRDLTHGKTEQTRGPR